MTRFARAKGSKASNERVPEDSTPWEVMKEQLIKSKKETEESKKREEAEKQRQTNYDNFLKERKVQKHNSTWCDFSQDKNIAAATNAETNKNKKTKLNAKHEDNVTNAETNKNKKTKLNAKNEDNVTNAETNKNKKTKLNAKNEDNVTNAETNKNKKKKPNAKNEDNEQSIANFKNGDERTVKTKVKKGSKDELDTQNDNAIVKTVKPHPNNANIDDESAHTEQQSPQAFTEKSKKKNKLHNDKRKARKKDDEKVYLIINGKKVELIKFDGFPIMKKDYERIKELRNDMIKKGIPKSEVKRTIKLERRRAEKALGRLRREVCYNCRKGGHNLSDCPDLKSKIPDMDVADGICFKCGSTEHRSFECKVQKDQVFRFATCFICKEQGHIARQCPDNAKGLYPNGGCCNLCGDVTHMRKDCPTDKDKKEEMSLRLDTMGVTDNLEGINENKSQPVEESVKKPKKIKF